MLCCAFFFLSAFLPLLHSSFFSIEFASAIVLQLWAISRKMKLLSSFHPVYIWPQDSQELQILHHIVQV